MGFFNFKKGNKTESIKQLIEATLTTSLKDIMTTYVISIDKNEKLKNAANVIVGEKVSCVVVKEHEKPIAVVTERDFVKKVPFSKEEMDKLFVKDVMSPKLVTVSSSTTVFDAIIVLIKNNFRKLVVSDNNQTIGIVTQTDFVKLMDKFYDELTIQTNDLLTIEKVMTKKVLTIDENEKYSRAKELMDQKDLGSMIITENARPVGITTEYDVVAKMVEDPERLKNITVGEVMTAPLIGIAPEVNIFDANRLMLKENIRRLPVVKDGQLLGMITQTDLCRAMYYFLRITLWHIEKQDLKFESLKKSEPEKILL
ncbi:MAG: CBS domain-containing protein [Nanoarchaeota archaeon]|nr:CBS domain-containing protein [Nanoarchaeota archaeon]MBU1030427.1 CBS domain-containing protein [Nanoarchaeota archaeon]MBU1849790.1 CBS domain-containing protein [Nanoarchaeota archaeon]